MDYDLPVMVFDDHKNVERVEYGLFRITLKNSLEYVCSGGPGVIREALASKTIGKQRYTIIPIFVVKQGATK